MTKKGLRARTLIIFIICITLVGLHFTGNPLLQLDKNLAKNSSLNGTIEHTGVDISDKQREMIIDKCADMSIAWLPSIESHGIPYFINEQRFYISLVFEEQMFLHIFVLNDGSMIAYIHPWNNNKGIYAVKNSEVLQDVVEIMVDNGIESRVVES